MTKSIYNGHYPRKYCRACLGQGCIHCKDLDGGTLRPARQSKALAKAQTALGVKPMAFMSVQTDTERMLAFLRSK